MENARVTNIRRVPQFYSPADEPYLASSSFEQFKTLSRVKPADDPFRDSATTSGIIRTSRDQPRFSSFSRCIRSHFARPGPPRVHIHARRARIVACGVRVWKRNQRVSSNSWDNCPRRIITTECGEFDIKSVARIYERTCAPVIFSLLRQSATKASREDTLRFRNANKSGVAGIIVIQYVMILDPWDPSRNSSKLFHITSALNCFDPSTKPLGREWRARTILFRDIILKKET